MAELKKCPFCGGEVKYEEFDDGFFAWGRVKCQCGVMLTTPKKVIIEAWNNRVTEAEIRAKAIDDFAEKAIKIVYEANNRRRNPQPRDMVADIHYKLRDLAEQLKECE